MLRGEVQIAEQLGGKTFLYVALASGESLVVEIQGQSPRRSGERLGVSFEPSAYHVFDAAGRALSLRR
jgi:ABC-type sugar transport system ATPase subunit